MHQAGGRYVLEHWIPAEDLGSFNAHIVGGIKVVAEYRGPVPDADFAAAEAALGRELPAAWREYLQGASWLRQGWLDSGAFVTLYPPAGTGEATQAWGEPPTRHPGVAIIGGNGTGERVALDLRSNPAPVVLVNTASAGWTDAILQFDNVTAFLDAIENGSFTFAFEPR